MINIHKKPNLNIIVALAQNGAIGKNNDLLWHLSGDLKRFKQLTLGHAVVMGRKTWESLPKKPLPGRINIVISHNPDFAATGAQTVHSVNELFKMLRDIDDEIFVMGGATIYTLLLPFAKRLYVTRVYRDYEADVYFPIIDKSEFTLVKQSDLIHDEESGLDYAYEEYDRKVGVKSFV